MSIIKAKDVTFEYIRRDDEGNVEGITTAVDKVNLDIKQGDFIAILGHNGSGKSTLAKHMNAILCPTEGTLWVDGMDTKDEKEIWNIRQTAGMVFQNPDNQIIGQVVEEDVGFGPENMGIESKEIWERVEESLKAVDMYEYRKSSPNRLSGGQKQRVSIAGVIAMHPKCIILDEPTAMLDPNGRKEVIRAVRALNEVEGVVGLTNKLGADIYQMIGMGNRSKSIKVEIGSENELSVYCDITIAYGHCVVTVAKATQTAIANAVEAISGVKSTSVNINVSGVVRV